MTAFKKRYATVYSDAARWLSKFDPVDRLSISVDYAARTYGNGLDVENRPFLLDFAIHLIDLVGYLFGDVSRVFCMARHDLAYAVSMQFTCGAVGSMNLTTGRSFTVPTEELEITVAGGNFMTIHNSSCYRITEGEKPVAWREPPLFTSAGDSGLDTGHGAELTAFVTYLRDGTRPRSQIAESYKSMVLFEAIARSASTRELVAVLYEEV
jgi:predicted dehydrogenase